MIWNKLAAKYDRLWVQKYSLIPTRNKVLQHILELDKIKAKLLDLGCGTGQSLVEINRLYPHYVLYGLDKSKEMIEMAKGKHTGAMLFCEDIDGMGDEVLEDASFDIIICSHSFPYYKNKAKVIEKVFGLLKDDGLAIFTQASVNSRYDHLVMKLIEKTAEPADYLTVSAFKKLVKPWFNVKKTYLIREKRYMPSICGFVMSKRL